MLKIGDKYKTNNDLAFAECLVKKGTVAEVIEKDYFGDYKVFFKECEFDEYYLANGFKNEYGTTQILEEDFIFDYMVKC